MVLSQGWGRRGLLMPCQDHSFWIGETGAISTLLRKLGQANHMPFLGQCQGLIDLKGGGRGSQQQQRKRCPLPLFPLVILCPDTIFGPMTKKPRGALKLVPRNCGSPRSILRYQAGRREANQMLTDP